MLLTIYEIVGISFPASVNAACRHPKMDEYVRDDLNGYWYFYLRAAHILGYYQPFFTVLSIPVA
jgi:hypothetical protein